MTDILSNFYKKLDSKDSQILSYLILGRVAPFFVDSEFNYSEKSFLSLLGDMTKTRELDLNVEGKRDELGDIGDTLEYFSNKFGFKTEEISLEEIYSTLWDIVNAKGTGSVEVKNKIIVDTLSKLSPLEAKYFSRIVCGDLRFGVNAKTLLDVFSVMVKGDKSMRDELDRAYGAYADIGYICSLLKRGNIEHKPGEEYTEKEVKTVQKRLQKVKVQPGIPLLARLVERVPTFEEVFERLGEEVLVQTKYDGLRCQIHKFKNKELSKKEIIWLQHMQEEGDVSLFETTDKEYNVRLFTRNLEDVTDMFPEIVQSARDMEEESFILDSEVLGWDSKAKVFLPFQETMQRRRKHNVKGKQAEVPVRAVVFDLLYLEGESLLQKDTEERINKLENLKGLKKEGNKEGPDTRGGIQVTVTKSAKEVGQLKDIFNQDVAKGHEGVIVKQKKGAYLPGTRNYEWIKLKKSMLKGLVDTIDLVAVGYNLGSGRRKDLGVGSVLGAAYNEEKDVFETVCNVGTGFTDEQLKEISSILEKDSLEERPNNVKTDKDLDPDVWVEPKIVFTVEADEITQKKDTDSLSLRFPRLVEWGRDKGPVEATSTRELEKMYREG